MTEPTAHPPFDDPGLKAALRRSLDREAAPAGLRDRVLALRSTTTTTSESRPHAGFGAESDDPDSSSPRETTKPAPSDKPIPLFRRSPLYRLAVAAILLIGFGGLAYQIWDMNRSPYDPAVAIPDSLYRDMLKTHVARVNGSASPDAATTLAAAGALSGQINRPVFVADLTKDGWTYHGAAVRNVGANPTAQLFFTKGKASVSVFSMPASAAPDARDGETYETDQFAGQPIAGFTRGKGLFCIVGSSTDNSLTIRDVRTLLDRHKSDLIGS